MAATSRLTALSDACRARGARGVQTTFDLRNPHTAIEELRSILQRESIDLVVVNAEVTSVIGGGQQLESLAAARETWS